MCQAVQYDVPVKSPFFFFAGVRSTAIYSLQNQSVFSEYISHFYWKISIFGLQTTNSVTLKKCYMVLNRCICYDKNLLNGKRSSSVSKNASFYKASWLVSLTLNFLCHISQEHLFLFWLIAATADSSKSSWPIAQTMTTPVHENHTRKFVKSYFCLIFHGKHGKTVL